MTTTEIQQDDDYTEAELLAMDDDDFAEAAAEDLHYTSRPSSPFMKESLCQRTLHVLIDRLWFIDSVIQRRVDDPNYPADKYEKTLAFRRHLLATIELTERQVTWFVGFSARDVSAWKKLLHDVLDEIELGPNAGILDELTIPYQKLSLRTWLEVRRVKSPDRVKVRGVAA